MFSLKKILCFFVSVVFLMSCSDKANLKIGLSVHSYKSERWIKDKDLFVEKVTELGGSVVVAVADNDADKQFRQAKELLNSGISVLVVIPENSIEAAKIVEEAHKYNVKVIAYDRLIKNCDLDYYISFDNIEVGKLQAEYLTNQYPKGKYALIGGAVSDYNSIFLKLGHMGVLQAYVENGDIDIAYDVFVDEWTAEEGYNHTLKCLEVTNDSINVIIAASDALTSGVIKALKEKNLAGKVLVCGQDGDLQACRAIVKGEQTMTVYKPIKNIAYKAASSAIMLAKGEALPDAHLSINNGKKMVASILLETFTAVNKENLELTVIADGYLKAKEIYE